MTRIVAVDIGNSYLHAQVFETSDLARTPADPMDADPPHRLHRALRAAELASLPTDVGWFLASVNRDRQEELTAWLTARGSESRAISRRDCPLAVALPAPVTAGVDRLVAAVAANHLRDPATPAIVIDSGTATTVDVVDRSGAFRGGAILAGAKIAAEALAQETDALPFLEAPVSAPAAIGDTTVGAMASGAYWGALGAVRELIQRLAEELDEGSPEVFVTGGGAIWAGPLSARHVPDLTLQGVALVAAHLLQQDLQA